MSSWPELERCLARSGPLQGPAIACERFGFRQVTPITEKHGVACIPMRLESRDNADMEQAIEHQENGAKGAFYVEQDGRRLAEMSYSRTNATLVIVDHTEVDASLGGQGVGRKLLDAMVQWARATGTKVVPLCTYAKAQFDKDPSIRDVLV